MINNYCDLVCNIKNVFLFCSPDSTTITPLAFLFFLHCPTTIPPFYLSGSTTHRHPSDYRQSVLLGLLSHDCNHLTFYDHTQIYLQIMIIVVTILMIHLSRYSSPRIDESFYLSSSNIPVCSIYINLNLIIEQLSFFTSLA